MVRLIVSDVPFTSTSTSPDWRPEKRCDCVYGTNSTFAGSPNTATATALQKSTSNPCHWPASLGVANPAAWEMPHLTAPRARTVSRVAPAATVLLDRAVSTADPELELHANKAVIPSVAAKRRPVVIPSGATVRLRRR